MTQDTGRPPADPEHVAVSACGASAASSSGPRRVAEQLLGGASAAAGSSAAAPGRGVVAGHRRPDGAGSRARRRPAPAVRVRHADAVHDDAAQVLAGEVVGVLCGSGCAPLLEHAEQRRGHEDRRVGAGEHADQQGDGELLAGSPAEDPRTDDQQRHHRQDGRDRGVQRPQQHLVHRQVHHIGVRSAAAAPTRRSFSSPCRTRRWCRTASSRGS